MTHERTDLADRAGTVIPRPSQELIDAISRGNQMPDTLRGELRSITGAFDRRFGEDLAALRAGKAIDQLAQRHGLDPNVLASARDVLSQLDKGIKQARAQDRAQTVSRGGPVR
ncbi:hypothetical protein GCM10011499_38160 [Pelagibacterium lentulum]|uniref:Uncharacterized protein n=2 Tax=Pelagibacterium lentulum TaxID=2029865 RepID=A0A916RS55_9HYPH|nr:hypothetical protein GCM10011499_38160 [Pelagibacterium lentulum]